MYGKPRQLGGIYDSIKAQWDSAVAGLQDKETQFSNAMSDLVANRNRYYAAGLQSDYDALVSRGNTIQAAVVDVMNTVAGVYDWFKNVAGLGVIPAIPVAAVIGVSTVIGGFILAYQALQAALANYEISLLPADQQAAARASLISAQSSTTTSDIKSTVITIGLIALAVMVVPKLLKQR